MDNKEFEEEMRHRRAWVAENLDTLLTKDLINDITGSDQIEDVDDLKEAFEDGLIDTTAAYR